MFVKHSYLSWTLGTMPTMHSKLYGLFGYFYNSAYVEYIEFVATEQHFAVLKSLHNLALTVFVFAQNTSKYSLNVLQYEFLSLYVGLSVCFCKCFNSAENNYPFMAKENNNKNAKGMINKLLFNQECTNVLLLTDHKQRFKYNNGEGRRRIPGNTGSLC